MWKRVRVSILLVVLGMVAGDAWLEQRRAVSWRDSLYVGVFPMAADDRPATRAYLMALRPESFLPLEPFFQREARGYGLSLERPFRFELFPTLAELPPPVPVGAGALATAWWSLRMRWYAWRLGSAAGRLTPHIRVFVLYHDPALNPELPHSVGLSKGRIGLVHAFASAALNETNAIVIAHEVLHTVGATDKYDPATNAPLFPQGFADADQRPRYPQQRAEIMAGRRAISEREHDMPDSLDDCVVGAATAAEIGWPRH